MEIFGTLGPALLSEAKLGALIDAGVTIFRINGAHSDGAGTTRMIEEVRRQVGDRAKIMVDLPTNKIRVRDLGDPIVFGPGERFVLHAEQLNYPPLCKLAQMGDEVIVNDGKNRLEVTRAAPDAIEFRPDASGQLGNNKGLIFTRDLHDREFPYFFERDLELIEVINAYAVDYVGLSYVRYEKDKQEALRRIENRDSLIYKVETRSAWENLESLIHPGDMISIDRGDLAGEIGLLNIPHAQDRIIRFAHRHRVEVFVATQFLATMEHSPIPLVSEVTGLYEMIKLGVSGIQLSEETAVGLYPVESVRWVREIEALVEAEGYLASAHRQAS